MKKAILIISLCFSFVSCEKSNEDFNTKKEILVLGNSITKCAPGGEWLGDWGMAASSPNKDFCGILSKSFNVNRKNIAIWENNFYCDESHYKFVTNKHYDYIIFKIGENVSDLQNFKEELTKIVLFYKNFGSKIVLVTTVWSQYSFDENGNPFEVPSDKDRIIKEVSEELNCILVDISDMKQNSNNYAWNDYQDSAIASHPNDLGMKFIANKIIQKIQ